MKNQDYGTVNFNGITYTLTSQAEMTNRLINNISNNYNDVDDGEEYQFELSASAEYDDGNPENENLTTGTIYWVFTGTKGENDPELDSYNYDDVDRFVED